MDFCQSTFILARPACMYLSRNFAGSQRRLLFLSGRLLDRRDGVYTAPNRKDLLCCLRGMRPERLPIKLALGIMVSIIPGDMASSQYE